MVIAMYKDIFAIRIKEKRIELGYSQEKIGAETGLTRQRINRLENGERIPNIEDIGRLATFFDCTSDYLLGIGK